MNEDKARSILNRSIREDGSLGDVGEGYVAWTTHTDKTAPKDSSWNRACAKRATLDGTFTADELEAIAWWMRNKSDI